MAGGGDTALSYVAGERVAHPYKILHERILEITPAGGTILDLGCGRTAPSILELQQSNGHRRFIGVDLVAENRRLNLIRGDVTNIGLRSECFDTIYSRSVMEHLERPAEVYREARRLLKPNGVFVFLTPNLWDYVSLAAAAIPNRWHPSIVHWLTGRNVDDTFPTSYRSNTARAIRRLAADAGFAVSSLRYLAERPVYLERIPGMYQVGLAYARLADRFPWLKGWIFSELRREQ